jgi:hypothetical protein
MQGEVEIIYQILGSDRQRMASEATTDELGYKRHHSKARSYPAPAGRLGRHYIAPGKPMQNWFVEGVVSENSIRPGFAS